MRIVITCWLNSVRPLKWIQLLSSHIWHSYFLFIFLKFLATILSILLLNEQFWVKMLSLKLETHFKCKVTVQQSYKWWPPNLKPFHRLTACRCYYKEEKSTICTTETSPTKSMQRYCTNKTEEKDNPIVNTYIPSTTPFYFATKSIGLNPQTNRWHSLRFSKLRTLLLRTT